MIRWGIMGTADIARGGFLPALQEAGGGEAWLVASRDMEKARQFAAQNGVVKAAGDYHAILESDEVDAIYIPLPNHAHYEWTMKALKTGKPVVCEKPLSGSWSEAEALIKEAQRTHALLWEAYAFQFQPQWLRVQQLVWEGAIGDHVEIHGTFNTVLGRPGDARWFKAFQGGALNDLGCYPVHVTSLLLKDLPGDVWARAHVPQEVDESVWAVLRYAGMQQLIMNVSFVRRYDTQTRIIGSEGEIRLSNTYHPSARDAVEIRTAQRVVKEYTMQGQKPFTDMIRHVHAVMQGVSEPIQLVRDVAWPTLWTMEQIRSRWSTVS
ncbi:MAG: gfo/Idh/MocA family oxidoreductase [Sulfobacillus thermosulfidooxidans]|uniref:Oxidoreductase n=1 Tax=Sulfobacillus thermotolerans TaxID=338644 RepID=A0ABM6RV56_9FIRM|nr:Gfo/Idh/MocA family oxidoreductase [Sulfobacillus sp. hq2]AUW95103.1 hypothetical protein BXT84_15030 [Sulfobacillus thermotolerans]POB10291.1 hypothetical protein CO251_10060 [Sulfobacillus sp. hq2]PSR37167.1 MAG: gfo/Idh/MocA family oxidoreductase [Sulfobacillus thermosulfidooxidans]